MTNKYPPYHLDERKLGHFLFIIKYKPKPNKNKLTPMYQNPNNHLKRVTNTFGINPELIALMPLEKIAINKNNSPISSNFKKERFFLSVCFFFFFAIVITPKIRKQPRYSGC